MAQGERKAAAAAAVFSVSLLFMAWQTSCVNAQVNNTNPDFLFVHGIGHGAWCFTPLITLLQEAGYTATAIDLTSHGINKAIADDVVTVAQYLEPLTTFMENSINKSTIICGHSLGGAVISVIAEMFSHKVSKAVFLAGVYPSDGDTFFNAMPPSTLKRLVGDGNLILNGNPPTSASLKVSNLTAFFYNKSPKWTVNLASTVVVPTPYRPGTTPNTLTKEKFGATRKFYVMTGKDFGITAQEQQEMIDVSPYKPEKIYVLPEADHGLYFSQKAALAKILVKIAETP
ncbi:unnamed protein product [Calypogeia fissa]